LTGTPQHIKSKFGDGYTLVIKVRHSTTPIKGHIETTFVGSILEEEHRGYLHYRLPSSSIHSLPAIFSLLELAKRTFDLEDYELTQTSLESIFCKFAQAQIEEDAKPKTKARKAKRAHNNGVPASSNAVAMHAIDHGGFHLTDDEDDDDALLIPDEVGSPSVALDLPRNLGASVDADLTELSN
jgi:hypothetical protein